MAGKRRKLISGTDVLDVGTLLALMPLALAVPVRFWPPLCDRTARALSLLGAGHFRRLAGRLAEIQGDDDVDTGARQCIEMMLESRLHLVDQNLLGRQPLQVTVTGKAHLDAALQAGRGVVLWNMPTAFSDLMVKAGLSAEGYGITQLSRPEHGFSGTAFGVGVLNRVRTRVEDRALVERIEIDAGTERQAMIRLRRILKDNGIVNITLGPQSRSRHPLPLAHGALEVATGPVRLASAAGAALLPVFSGSLSPMSYEVIVEAPVNDGDAGLDAILGAYSMRLQGFMRRYPWQARGLAGFSTRPAGSGQRPDSRGR